MTMAFLHEYPCQAAVEGREPSSSRSDLYWTLRLDLHGLHSDWVCTGSRALRETATVETIPHEMKVERGRSCRSVGLKKVECIHMLLTPVP